MHTATPVNRRAFLARGAQAAGALALASQLPAAATAGKAVAQAHPRLLGTRAELQALAKARPADYQRLARIARAGGADDWSKVMSLGLVAAIEQDRDLAQQARDLAMKCITGPIRKGHVTFGGDLALCALAYDLGHEAWSADDVRKFAEYFNATVDANVQSETHVFHNAWYGYKNWGIGLGGYALYHENPRAREILQTLDQDYRVRAAPALELAGAGGGWAEGYYIHYWLYEWLFFCEAARRCAGVDYYALAPKFYRQRAIAGMFEMYPGIGEYNSRRPLPMGDGGGRTFGGDRDKTLAARRILVSYYRADAAHQAVQAFNETTPRSSVGNYAYKDFLWRDPALPKGDLEQAKLSHASPGPGFVYARSSWAEDATAFFFKCGPRFTAHQHLDANHFVIYKHAELAGDGGHYDDFGSPHDVNYHCRSIAHSTVLVHDPEEAWPAIRAGKVTHNDGGQHHHFPHHNGALGDVADWEKRRAAHDTARLQAYQEAGEFVYMAGDASRAYSPKKMAFFTRQIVFLRPVTFVIFDRVKATRPEFKKTWLLQAMRPPEREGDTLVITNGKGCLYLQPLLPAERRIELVSGADLYRCGGQEYPPRKNTGPAPECRVEITPAKPTAEDYFLHVLTAAGADEPKPLSAKAVRAGDQVRVEVAGATVTFHLSSLGGSVVMGGRIAAFVDQVLGG